MVDYVEESNRILMSKALRAALYSPDLSTQNGAVVVSGPNVLGLGCNRPPLGVKARLERPQKYDYTEHAERAALWNAVNSSDGRIEGCTLFALWAACADCARSIIEARISKVVTMSFYANFGDNEGTSDRWADSIGSAGVMLSEAGVEVEFWTPERPLMDDAFPGLRFNGEVVRY